MEIIKLLSTYNTGIELDHTIEMKCDCGRHFETHYYIELIMNGTTKEKRFIDFNYCPYCGKKIELEGLGYR